jgi:hypothetical protein
MDSKTLESSCSTTKENDYTYFNIRNLITHLIKERIYRNILNIYEVYDEIKDGASFFNDEIEIPKNTVEIIVTEINRLCYGYSIDSLKNKLGNLCTRIITNTNLTVSAGELLSMDGDTKMDDKKILQDIHKMLAQALQDIPESDGNRASLHVIKQAESMLDKHISTISAPSISQQPTEKQPVNWVDRIRNSQSLSHLPSFEENLAKCGLYGNRKDKRNALEFLQEEWGEYLNCFNGGCGDYIYQDQLRKIDKSLVDGLNNLKRTKTWKVSDYIPEKSERVKKENEELFKAVEAVGDELPMKLKLHRLQKAGLQAGRKASLT